MIRSHMFANEEMYGVISPPPLLIDNRRLIMIRTCNRLLTSHVLCMHSKCAVHVRNE